MKIQFSAAVKEKLFVKHSVVEKEVFECFANREGNYLKDNREKHQTTPPTLWLLLKRTEAGHLKFALCHPIMGSRLS